MTTTSSATAAPLSATSNAILSFISILDHYGAWTWNLRMVGVTAAVALGFIRIAFASKHNVPWYALVHSFVTGVGGAMVVYLDLFAAEAMTGTPEPLRTVQCEGPLTSLHRILPAITMGYSLFDIVEGFGYGSDFLMHGIATFLVFTFFCENSGFTHLITPMLYMEVSTIFLNMMRAEFLSESSRLVVQLLFALSFVVVRVFMIPRIWFDLLTSLYQRAGTPEFEECFPSYIPKVILVFGIFYHSLNAYWLVKIIKKIQRTIQKTKKSDTEKEEN